MRAISPPPRFFFLSLLALYIDFASSCDCCTVDNDNVLTACGSCPANTTALRLGSCGLTAILPGAFSSPLLSRVAFLDLSNNALRELPAGAFAGLPALVSLDLSSNFIASVSPGALSGDSLPALATLDLGFNALPAVPPSLNLPNLTSLSLYWNPVASFSNASFLGVPRLQYLDANNCGLSTVSVDAFAPLPALTTLNLGHNALTELPDSGWRGPSQLTTLALPDNALGALPPRFVAAFPLLETLPLSANRLAALAAGTFSALTSLAGLYLDDNNITALQRGCFDGLSGQRFQYLALAHNKLAPAACNANFAAVASIPSACFS